MRNSAPCMHGPGVADKKTASRLPAHPGLRSAAHPLSFPWPPLTPQDFRCFLLCFLSIPITSKGCAVRQPAFEFSSLIHLLGKGGEEF